MTRALGIDIGNFAIKIAEIDYTSKSRDLIGLYDIPRDPNTDASVLLKEFLQQSSIKAERIAISIGAAPVFIKRMELPFSDPKRYIPAIQSELEDTLPFELSEYVLDIQKVGKIGKLTQFLVGICPKTWTDRINKIAEDSGFIPNAFLLDAQTLGKMALHQHLPAMFEETSVAVVDFGSQSTKIALIKGYQPDPHDKTAKAPSQPGEVTDFRTISHGSQELVQWIQERKGIDGEESKQWLIHRAEIRTEDTQEEGVAADLSDEIKVALRPVVVEIYQAIQAFKGKHNISPSTLYLTGGMSDIKGLREFLADELRIAVNPWPIFLGYNTERVPITPEKERSFAVALSMAHRFVLQKSQGWLNFRRSHSAKTKILTTAFEAMLNPTFKPLWLMALGIFAFATVYNLVSYHYLNQEKDSLKKEVVSEYLRFDKSADRKKVESWSKSLGDLESHFSSRKKEKDKETSTTREKKAYALPKSQLLLDLTVALPAGAKLTSFASTNPLNPTEAQFEATIRAERAFSDAQFDEFKANIEKSLKERSYTLTFEKLLTGKDVRIKGLNKGGKL